MAENKATALLPAAQAMASRSRAEQVYRRIHDSIQNGELRPGHRLREVELAQWMGISRTPVREALTRLENDGLVVNDAQRGMIVAELDHQMVTELYVMREMLEGTAAGLAAKHASEADIAVLQELLRQDRAAAGDAAVLANNNKRFHDTIYRSAHNRYLLKTLNTLRDSLALLGPTTLGSHDRASNAIEEHAEIVEAIIRRDAAAAEDVARQHIRSAYQARIRMLFQNA